jgi:ribonuclease HI
MGLCSLLWAAISDREHIIKPKQQVASQTVGRRADSWLAPPPVHCKIMVDGALNRAGHKRAVGAICRNHSGLYMGSAASAYLGISDSAILETLACREALALAEDLGIREVSISSDCQGIFKDISAGSVCSNATVVREINDFVLSFTSVRFIHERRQFVVEAHNLARAATSLESGRHLWLLDPPEIVLIPMSILNIVNE